MQPNKGYQEIKTELKGALKDHFGEKIGTFTTFNQTDTPYTMFSMQFEMYNYFQVVLNYDRGAFGCAIIQGELGITLDTKEEWYDKADLSSFCKILQQEIEIRIPDKFLRYKGWK